MENCIDCGNNTPLPKNRKALFLDLDHTLIRPKSGGRVEVKWPANTSTEDVTAMIQAAERSLPKHIELLHTDTSNPNGFAFVYRNTFPKDGKDWEFIPGVQEAIKPFLDNDFLIVIITNQGGIEAKFHTEEEVEDKLSGIMASLLLNYKAAGGGKGRGLIDLSRQTGYFYCPSMNPADPDRKPNPGMIIRAIEKLGIDVNKSLFVGDMQSDADAALKAGIACFTWAADFIKLGETNFFLLEDFTNEG